MRCFDDDKIAVSVPLLRAAAVVYASYGDSEFRVVRKSASRLLRNSLADVVKLIERIQKYALTGSDTASNVLFGSSQKISVQTDQHLSSLNGGG